MSDQWIEWPDAAPPRRLTKEKLRQLFTEARPVVVEGFPEAHHVWLKVTNQEFCVARYCDTREEAEWMRDQLCIALDRIVREAVE